MATAFQRLQAALAQLENVPEAEIPELPPLAREFDPTTAEGSELVRFIPERGKPIKNLLNRLAAELGIATPRMWRERERDLVVGEEAWQGSVAAAERIFADGVQGAMQYAMTDIDREQLVGITKKFEEGLTAARSQNPELREFGAKLMADAQAQLAPWLEDIETRREALIDGELRHIEVLYRDGEKDLGVAESVRDAAVLRLGQFAAKWNTVDFDDASLTERQRKALALDEIGYMAQSPDLLSGLLRGAQSIAGVTAGAALAASNPYARTALALVSGLAAGASNIRDLADDFTAAELRDIIEAGYRETQRQTEYRMAVQLERLNDLEKRRAELSQMPMMRREHSQSATPTRGEFHPSMRETPEPPLPGTREGDRRLLEDADAARFPNAPRNAPWARALRDLVREVTKR
jgi:hypothetical protein